MKYSHEDTYFLDRDLAYQTALAHNIVTRSDGEKAVQVCYYDGDPFEHAPENLVNVPANEFTRYFSTHPQRLPAKVETSPQQSPDEPNNLAQTLEGLLQTVKQNLSSPSNKENTEPVLDTLFLDPEMALAAASRQQTVDCGDTTLYGTQICYYSGDVIDNAPENLVNVPCDDFLDFFSNTRLRLPRTVVFREDIEYDEKDKLAQAFGELLSQSIANRNKVGTLLRQECQQTKPDFQNAEPLRVLLTTSRYDNIKRPIIEGFFDAFEQHHCKTRLIIEQSSLEKLDTPWLFKEHFSFNPHVVLTIDSFDTNWLHPDVFNIVLWWKPAYDISIGAPLSWRNRDIALPSNDHNLNLLSKSGAKSILSNLVGLDPSNPNILNIDYGKTVSAIIDTIQQKVHLKTT